MKMKNFLRSVDPFFIFRFSFFTLLFSGCVLVDLYPGRETVTLTTDIELPASYRVRIGEYRTTQSGKTNELPDPVAPGSYRLIVYNNADKITVNNDTVASVTPVAGKTDFIETLPGLFFTSVKDVTIEPNKDNSITAQMSQQVRELNIVLSLNGNTARKITSITAVLEGVAGSFSILRGIVTGEAKKVALVFDKQGDGTYKATTRLLGIIGSTQKLTVEFKFEGGVPADKVIEESLAAPLANFNTDKKTPMTLSAIIVDLLSDAGFTVTISDWTDVTGSGTAK